MSTNIVNECTCEDDLGGSKTTETSVQLPKTKQINFDIQKYTQRQWIFWIALSICGLLYLASLTLIFCPATQLKELMDVSPHAVFLPITLLVLPTLTLGVLAKAVYKLPHTPESEEQALPQRILTNVCEKSMS